MTNDTSNTGKNIILGNAQGQIPADGELARATSIQKRNVPTRAGPGPPRSSDIK